MGVPGAIDDVQPFAELFQGATTTVYKAYQRSLDRFVLLKRLRPEYRWEEVLSQGLEEEARMIARVQHPNVVAVYAHGRDEQGTYIVAEFVEGVDLRALIERGRLPHELAAFVLLESARGLKAAHEKGVLHRDLKPANILISHEGAVKLTDFGMASLLASERDTLGDAADASASGGAGAAAPARPGEADAAASGGAGAAAPAQPGEADAAASGRVGSEGEQGVSDDASQDDREIRGTLAYLAPEQVLGEAPSRASDLFSLGATFYELITGRRAFQGVGPSELFDAVLNYDPMPFLSADARVPARLVEITAKLLAKNPAARYQDCGELLLALDAYRASGAPVGSSEGLKTFLESPERYVPAAEPAAPAYAPDLPPKDATTSGEDRRPRLVRRAGAGAIGVLIVAGLLYASFSGPALNVDDPAASEETSPLPVPAGPADDLAVGSLEGDSGEPGAGAGAEPGAGESDAGREGAGDAEAERGDPEAQTDAGRTGAGTPAGTESTGREVTNGGGEEDEVPLAQTAGAIRVDVKPFAEVVVAGRSLGTTPLRAELPAGTHQILLRHREFPEHTATVDVRPGEETTVSVSLWAQVGQIELEVAPWGYVYIDDVVRDTVPPQTRPLIVKPGRHSLSIVHPTLGRRDTTIVIPAGTRYRFRFNFNR